MKRPWWLESCPAWLLLPRGNRTRIRSLEATTEALQQLVTDQGEAIGHLLARLTALYGYMEAETARLDGYDEATAGPIMRRYMADRARSAIHQQAEQDRTSSLAPVLKLVRPS